VLRGKKSGGREGLRVREEGYVKIEKGARGKGMLKCEKMRNGLKGNV
jgi:hypothetical protein